MKAQALFAGNWEEYNKALKEQEVKKEKFGEDFDDGQTPEIKFEEHEFGCALSSIKLYSIGRNKDDKALINITFFDGEAWSLAHSDELLNALRTEMQRRDESDSKQL